MRAGNSSKVLAPQGVTVADFPSGNELDAANGVVHEDAAIEISRKLVVDSLKVSPGLLHLARRSARPAFSVFNGCYLACISVHFRLDYSMAMCPMLPVANTSDHMNRAGIHFGPHDAV